CFYSFVLDANVVLFVLPEGTIPFKSSAKCFRSSVGFRECLSHILADRTRSRGIVVEEGEIVSFSACNELLRQIRNRVKSEMPKIRVSENLSPWINSRNCNVHNHCPLKIIWIRVEIGIDNLTSAVVSHERYSL